MSSMSGKLLEGWIKPISHHIHWIRYENYILEKWCNGIAGWYSQFPFLSLLSSRKIHVAICEMMN